MDAATIFDDHLTETVYRDKQVAPEGVHLTVKEICSLSDRAQVDFGGGEFEPAGSDAIAPAKRSSGDDYGWWELHEGEYLVRFNEEVSADDYTFLVVSNDRLVGCGCSLSAVYVSSGPIEAVLRVPEEGVSIKENARIALINCVVPVL